MGGVIYSEIFDIDKFLPLAFLYSEGDESEYKSGSVHKVSFGMGARNLDFREISQKEKSVIDTIIQKWRSARTNEVVAFTHHQKPYILSQENEIIPYELILREKQEIIF
jgi:uncharacterized phage-associated protein